MKKVFRTRYERQLLRQRGIIDTMFGYLKNNLMLWHTRHRSLVNACVHLMSCLANWIIKPISIISQKSLNAMSAVISNSAYLEGMLIF